MSLADDPRYRALARRAAAVMGTASADIAAAILAQWTCELGNADAYPPARNNPGNLSRGAAAGLGVPFRVTYPNPQPGNPIVTYQVPADGADAYARLINTGSRYAGVRAAVAAGSGGAYIAAIARSGYGTSGACMAAAYHPVQPNPTPPPSEGTVPQIPIVDYTGHHIDVAAPMTFYNLDASVQSTGHGGVTNAYSPYIAKNGTSTFHAMYARQGDGTYRLILTKPSAVRP